MKIAESTPPRQISVRVRRFGWETTPGKLRIVQALLVLGILLVGSIGVYAAHARVDTLRDIAEHLEPLNATATTLYRSLADADTTVAVGFLSGRAESTQIRARYDGDVDLATVSVAQIGIQPGVGSATTDQITNIMRQLPVYAGLVERARANNRQGLAVGVAYLRLASDLMQNRILPQAAELQRRQATRLDEAYRRAASVPVIALAAVGASLVGLVWIQIFLFQHTHRVFNPCLVAASASMLIGLLWWTAASAVSTGPLTSSHRHSQSVSQGLGPAQIAALQARTVESLGLARTGITTELDFNDRMRRLAGHGGALDTARGLATDQRGRDLAEVAAIAASNYSSAHRKVQQLDGSPQYAQAIEAAVSTEYPSSATAFDQLDTALIRAVDYESAAFKSDINRARSLLTGLPIGIGVLALIAAVEVAWGLRQRLEEYR